MDQACSICMYKALVVSVNTDHGVQYNVLDF